MKVLHITLRADTGGGPEHINILVQNLPKFIESHIACPNQAPYWDIYKNAIDGRVLKLPYRKFSLFSLINLVVYCKKTRINLLHTHGKGAGLYGKLCSRLLGVPLIHTPHGLHLPECKGIKDYLYLIYEKLTQRWLDCVVFVSESEKKKADEYGLFTKVRTAIVNNGVKDSGNLIHRLELRNNLRNTFCIPPESLVCITLTRFSPEKNVSLILDIADQCRNIYFMIFGDGSERRSIYERVKLCGYENVLTPGVTDISRDFLIGSDMYLSTSLGEGLPLSVLEAMSCGLPVVASRVSGHVDCVVEGVTGFLFNLNDVECAVKCIEDLSADASLRAKLGSEGRSVQRKLYSVEAMVNGIVDQYINIADQ